MQMQIAPTLMAPTHVHAKLEIIGLEMASSAIVSFFINFSTCQSFVHALLLLTACQSKEALIRTNFFVAPQGLDLQK